MHRKGRRLLVLGLAIASCCLNLGLPSRVHAVTQVVNQNVNVSAVVPGPPPTTQAIITSPVNGQNITTTPLVVSGSCEPGLFVRVFVNGNLAGQTTCSPGGTFTMNITLAIGRNDISAFVYDSLNQAGPNSNIITVNVVPPREVTIPSPAQGVPTDSAGPTETVESTDQGIFEGTPFERTAFVLGVGTSRPVISRLPFVNSFWGLIVSILVVSVGVYWLVARRVTRSKSKQSELLARNRPAKSLRPSRLYSGKRSKTPKD